ncbi:MAG: phytanoyl-CoA dioxygenase family protein [Planctomycetota bacterium]
MPLALSSPVVQPLQLTPAEIKFYKEEGYLYLGGLLQPEMIVALRQEILDVVEGHFGATAEDLKQAISAADRLRQSSQYLRGSKLEELITGEEIAAIAAQLIGGPAYMYMPFTAVKAGGGGGDFSYHQDNNYTQHEPALGSINIWVALVDMSPENGCLQIVPRSHRDGVLNAGHSVEGDKCLDVDPLDCLPLRMRAGDGVAFTRLTVHGSGPNDSEEPRIAYALQFHRDDVKWIDDATGEANRLVETPRFAVQPIDRFVRED